MVIVTPLGWPLRGEAYTKGMPLAHLRRAYIQREGDLHAAHRTWSNLTAVFITVIYILSNKTKRLDCHFAFSPPCGQMQIPAFDTLDYGFWCGGMFTPPC